MAALVLRAPLSRYRMQNAFPECYPEEIGRRGFRHPPMDRQFLLQGTVVEHSHGPGQTVGQKTRASAAYRLLLPRACPHAAAPEKENKRHRRSTQPHPLFDCTGRALDREHSAYKLSFPLLMAE